MRKKAQEASQVFVYILTVVVIGIILLFGYKSIMDFKQLTDKISIVDFQKKLESSIISVTPEHSMKRKVFTLSNDFKEVCFVTNYGNPMFNPANFNGYPLIADAVIDSETGKNVFLISHDDQVTESFGLGKLRITGDFDCFSIVDGRLSISIEGKGDHVLIS